MDILDIMKSRHSVRQYTEKKLRMRSEIFLMRLPQSAIPKAALTSRLFMTSRHVLIP